MILQKWDVNLLFQKPINANASAYGYNNII